MFSAMFPCRDDCAHQSSQRNTRSNEGGVLGAGHAQTCEQQDTWVRWIVKGRQVRLLLLSVVAYF